MTMISVVIPTLDEEDGLPAAIAALRRAAGGERVEVIVADGGSRDGTAALARRLADKTLEGPPGRARQMHAGALAASGDLLVFLHADTRLPEGWPAAVAAARADGVAAAAFSLAFDDDGWPAQAVATLASWRTRATGVPQGDQALAVRARLYREAGGYPDVPLMEEYELARRLARFGRIVVLAQRAVTSARRYRRAGWLLNSARNGTIVALYHLGVPPRVLARLYR